MTDYDITFCEGELCAMRDTCHRYLHLLTYRADKDSNKKELIAIKLPPHSLKCSMYWDYKDAGQ